MLKTPKKAVIPAAAETMGSVAAGLNQKPGFSNLD
jgi:hypothetical protein